MKKGYLFFLLLSALLGVAVAPSRAADLERELHGALSRTRSLAAEAQVGLEEGRAIAAELAELHSVARDIGALKLLLAERYRDRQLQASAIHDDIGRRQQKMSTRLQTVVDGVLEHLRLLAVSPPEAAAELEPLRALLASVLQVAPPPRLGNLPYRHANLPSVIPISSPTVTPAYLGGTAQAAEVHRSGSPLDIITPEIAELARSLDWSPVGIYDWVQNNIETEWYWGSMKGAAETLRQKSGNDADQAALLVALLRAANYPARYVRGVIEFTPDSGRLQELTGLDDPSSAVRFLQQAGIPVEPVIAGGRIGGARVEHVWVETYVPYANYRGAVLDEQGKIWLPLDTHLKPQGYQVTLPAVGPPMAGVEEIREEYLQLERDETLLEYLRRQVEAETGAFWEQALTKRRLRQTVVEVLPASLQFGTVAVTGEYLELPDDLVQTVTFRGAAPDGRALFSLTLPVGAVSSRQVVVSYEPESVADQELIDAHGGLSNTPAYLVRLRPVLLVDGERKVVAADGLAMGEEYQLTVVFDGPAGRVAQTARHLTGNPSALGIVAQQAVLPPVLSEENQDAAWLLWQTAQDYLDRWNAAEDELAAFFDLRMARPFPTLVTVGGVLEVSRLLDMPQDLVWKGLFIDAGLRRIELAAQAGEQERVAEFMRLSALQGSALEERIFTDRFQVAAVSTARVLAQSRQTGQSLLTLTSANLAGLLPTLPLPEHIRTDIEAAVHQGLTVTLPPAESSLLLWSGFGYRKEDPATGEAGYMLSGRIAGGMTIEEWANGYSKDVLQAPFTDPPNRDPLSAVHIAKIAVGDRQSGIVGQQLSEPVAVLVTDVQGRPVVGAEVTFSHIAGLGKEDPAVTSSELTDAQGIARFLPVLGRKTGDNPSFQRINHDDDHVTQVGVNLFSAQVQSRYGKISIDQPFEIYGRPDKPASLLQLVGDGNRGIPNGSGGTLSLKVLDPYANPVSNVPVTFKVKSTASTTPWPLPATYRTLQFFKAAECQSSFPLWEDCGGGAEPSSTVLSSWHGAQIDTLFGDTVGTRYVVGASADGVQEGLQYTLFSGGSNTEDGYYPPQLSVRYLALVNETGEKLDAVRVGEELAAPLHAAMVLTSSGYLMEKRTCSRRDADGNPVDYDCWDLKGDGRIRTRRISGGDMTYEPTTGGTILGVKEVNPGIYQGSYRAGPEPRLNRIEVSGQARVTVPVVRGAVVDDTYFEVFGRDLDSPSIEETSVMLKSGQIALFDENLDLTPVQNQQKKIYSIFGVDVPTAVTPDIVMLGDGGKARQDVTVDYMIEPQGAGTGGYAAQAAQLDLLAGDCEDKKSDEWVGYLIGDATHGPGRAVYSKGSVFDPKQQYCVQTVLNRGSRAEIRGDKVKLQTLYADLDIDSDNNAGWQEDGAHNPPSRKPLEDQIEDLAGQPGKVLRLNTVDTDKDKVPGYADGINVNEQQGDGASQPFYPLKFTIEGSIVDPGAATVKFKYSGSNPALIEAKTAEDGTVSYPLPVGGGALRLWTKDGQLSRKVADFAEGGDYLTPDKAYPLGLFKDVETLFAEGIRGTVEADEKKITLVVDPDGPAGPLSEIDGDLVLATPIYSALLPDYNHDQVIDDLDRERAGLGDIFYFWINDDDDSGETGGSDIPGDTSFLGQLDCDSVTVDGVRDLIDFFPVAFETKELVNTFPLSRYKYRLRAQDSQVNVLFPELTTSTVRNYLVEVDTARRLSDLRTKLVPADGKMLGIRGDKILKTPQEELDEVLQKSASDADQPVLLFEGNKKSALPLTLDILDESDQEVFSTQLNLSLDGVEQMFRHVNLVPEIDPNNPAIETGEIGEHKAKGGEKNRLYRNDFSNTQHFEGFDADLKNEFIVLLHGANVDGQQSRGFQSEIFKRLYWSGSHEKLVGVTWYGSEGTNANYQRNVVHAFETAAKFGHGIYWVTLDSPVTLIAHSLGNMVLSSYLADYFQQSPLNIKNYFLVNAAVALEAYLGDYQGYAEGQLNNPGGKTFASDNTMVQSDWYGYDMRLGSSEWHQLFDADDPRRTLTWRKRFANLPESINYFSLYSSGDEVLATYAGETPDLQFPDVWNSEFGRYAWVLQEKYKGRDLPLGSTDLMGWGFNLETYQTIVEGDGGGPEVLPWEQIKANSEISNAQILSDPFFRKPVPDQWGAQLFEPTVDAEYVKSVRNQLLALAFPSLTLVTGGWLGEAMEEYKAVKPDNAINMNDITNKNGWPSNRGLDNDWKHSDLKDVGYVFSRKVFDKLVESGGMK